MGVCLCACMDVFRRQTYVCLKNFSEKNLGSCTGIVFCNIGRVSERASEKTKVLTFRLRNP